MAKLSMGIKDLGNLIITSRNKRGTVASNIEMHSDSADLPSINSNVSIKNPMGGAEDSMSMGMIPPFAMMPTAPSRIPTQMPLQEYSTFLPIAAASLAASLISTAKDEL